MLAMAHDGEKRNQNQSQFFITLAPEAKWLDKKHTIFGKVIGQTIFNLVKIGDCETDKQTDRPICELIPTIESALVIENPFEDLVPRILPKKEEVKEESAFKQRKTNLIKNRNLISFADDDEEEEEEAFKNKTKRIGGIRSSHQASHIGLSN